MMVVWANTLFETWTLDGACMKVLFLYSLSFLIKYVFTKHSEGISIGVAKI